MGTLCICSDPHLGNHRTGGGATTAGLNERARQGLKALNFAVTTARATQAEALIVAGDLFDSARPEPQLIAAAQEVLKGFPAVLLRGNHDTTSAALGDHALGPLDPVATIVEAPDLEEIGPFEVVLVPHERGNPNEWLPVRVAQAIRADRRQPGGHRVLVAHTGIFAHDTPPWMVEDGVGLDILRATMAEWGIGHAFLGHWHVQADHPGKSDAGGPQSAWQIGTLCPRDWREPGEHHGRVLILEERKGGLRVRGVEVPGPRFLVGSDLAVLEGQAATLRGNGHAVYLRLQGTRAEASEQEEKLEALKAAGSIQGWDVDPDQTDAVVAARGAAVAARQAGSLEEALSAFVQEMPLDEGVDRAKVLERCQGYLKGGAA